MADAAIFAVLARPGQLGPSQPSRPIHPIQPLPIGQSVASEMGNKRNDKERNYTLTAKDLKQHELRGFSVWDPTVLDPTVWDPTVPRATVFGFVHPLNRLGPYSLGPYNLRPDSSSGHRFRICSPSHPPGALQSGTLQSGTLQFLGPPISDLFTLSPACDPTVLDSTVWDPTVQRATYF